jgi:hypothetical protein
MFQGSPHQQQVAVMAQNFDQQPNISVKIPKT